jgi:hypothetical protein
VGCVFLKVTRVEGFICGGLECARDGGVTVCWKKVNSF